MWQLLIWSSLTTNLKKTEQFGMLQDEEEYYSDNLSAIEEERLNTVLVSSDCPLQQLQ